MRFEDAKITITPYPERKHPTIANALYVEMNYEGAYRAVLQQDGTNVCYMPIFNLYFYSKDIREIDTMAKIVFGEWMNGWMMDEGFGGFIRHLKVIGFEPINGVLDWNKLKKKEITRPIIFKPYKAKINIPEDFGGQNVSQRKVSQKFEMAY